MRGPVTWADRAAGRLKARSAEGEPGAAQPLVEHAGQPAAGQPAASESAYLSDDRFQPLTVFISKFIGLF